MIIELVVQICGDRNVGEHTMQFVGELIAAGLLQIYRDSITYIIYIYPRLISVGINLSHLQAIDHALLGIHALALLVY